jgi:hypothetical protein
MGYNEPMNLLRLLLSLLLVTLLIAPAGQASCGLALANAQQSCCCSADTVTISETTPCIFGQCPCVEKTEHKDSALPLNQAVFNYSVTGRDKTEVTASWIAGDGLSPEIAVDTQRRPLHQASNKIYLRKRLLLI